MSALRPQGGPGTLFLVDANNILFRAYHALPPLSAPDNTPVNAVHGYVRMMQALRKEFAPEYLVAIFDAKGPNFRHELFPDYKANRPPAPEDLIPQIALVREATAALGIRWVESSGYEADDLIAAYAKQGRAQNLSCTIVSADKDLMQLVGDPDKDEAPVILWDSMKSRAFGREQVKDKFGVYPERLGDLLALMGDSVDNVPGVPGIGPKTAALLLEEYGDLEGILENAPSIKQKKRRENLIEFADQARLSRKLVALDHTVKLPQSIAELADSGVDADTVRAFFEPLGFRSTITGILSGSSEQTGRRASGSKRAKANPSGATPAEGTIAAIEDFGAKVLGSDQPAELLTDAQPQRFLEVMQQLQGHPLAIEAIPDGDDPIVSGLCGLSLCGGQNQDLRVYIPLSPEGLGIQGRAPLPESTWREGLQALLSDPETPKIASGAKVLRHRLSHHHLELKALQDDPELMSYVLDPARGEHDVARLAQDLGDTALKSAESVIGKGKKAILFSQADWESCATYATQRASAALCLGKHLQQSLEGSSKALQTLYREVEMPLSEVLLRMEKRGILLDVEEIQSQAQSLGDAIFALRSAIEKEAGYPINPDSPLQLQKLLFEDRGLEPIKKTKTGFSTDAKVLEELSLLDPIVKDILEYRSLTKLKSTYLDALPKLVQSDGRIHSHFKQAVAQTGRLSSVDPNLQNIPIRTELGKKIRNAFVAPPGSVLVAIDYSQIELRVLAHLSEDKSLCGAFQEGADVHRRTAAEIFGLPESEVSDEQRRVAKAVNFGVIYGQSAFGLARQLGIRQGKAAKYIKSYFEKIPGVDRYMTSLVEQAQYSGVAETILGRIRRIPELSRRGATKAYGQRIARNTPIQGSAADILKVAMVQVEAALRDCTWARMLLTVHDELIFECEASREQELVDLVTPLMESAVQLRVPLVVESGVGPHWGAAKG